MGMGIYADIFAFTDFRLFLAEYFRVRSEKESSFTQAHICRKLGLPNTHRFFSDILRGGKPFSPTKTEGLGDVDPQTNQGGRKARITKSDFTK